MHHMGAVIVRGDDFPLIMKRQFSVLGHILRRLQPCLRRFRNPDNDEDDPAYLHKKVIHPHVETDHKAMPRLSESTPQVRYVCLFETG